MHLPEHVPVIVRHHHLGRALAFDVPPVDDGRDVECLARDGRERALELGALGRVRRELEDRFVLGRRRRVLAFVHRGSLSQLGA